MAAARGKNNALKYASDRLKHDHEIVMAAVKHDGYALKYAPSPLKAIL